MRVHANLDPQTGIFQYLSPLYSAVLRIHDILVWIRIRIRGSMPLTNGSGYCYFRHWSSRCQEKTNFLKHFFCLLLFEVTLTSFWKIKNLQNSRNQGFSYYFCMMIEGSGSGSIPVPLTNGSGSGSGRSKNIWIRWIRIQIRNTGIQEEERWARNPWVAWCAAVLWLRHSLLRLGTLAHRQLYSPGRRREHKFCNLLSLFQLLFRRRSIHSNSEENPIFFNEKYR